MTPKQLAQWAIDKNLPDAWLIAVEGEPMPRQSVLALADAIGLRSVINKPVMIMHESHAQYEEPDWVSFDSEIPPSPSMPDPSTFQNRLNAYLNAGWRVTSDGPTGVQLEFEKQMSSGGRTLMTLGVIGLLFFGLGLILILFAALDYWICCKPTTFFLSRVAPLPPLPEQRQGPKILGVRVW